MHRNSAVSVHPPLTDLIWDAPVFLTAFDKSKNEHSRVLHLLSNLVFTVDDTLEEFAIVFLVYSHKVFG